MRAQKYQNVDTKRCHPDARMNDPKRIYEVSASIAFHFKDRRPTTDEVFLIQSMIAHEDAKSPWLDEPNPVTGMRPSSICYWNTLVEAIPTASTCEYVLSVFIRTQVYYLRRAQVPAYEKYLFELATRIGGGHKLPDVSQIHTVLTTQRMTFIKTA
jgi:hypothetical protein